MTTTTTALGLRTARELSDLVRDRVLSSRELVDHVLDRIARLDPQLNAVVTLDADGARAAADAADAALADGRTLGPLHGLPVTVKDCLETAGMRTTSGAPELAGHVPAADAAVVARLRAAGAIVVGKTNLPPWASDCQTSNDLFGTTRNPWDTARTPGGSSGGAAVAVATGMSGLDLGSDLGGSIRLPAHWCGVYGLKPTFGVVPVRGHVPPAPGVRADVDIACIGPLARSADDLDLALSVLAGPDGPAAVAWRLALPGPRADRLDGYRIGVWLDDPHCPVDGGVGDVLAGAVAALGAAGARVVDVAADLSPTFAETDRLAQALVQAAVSAFLPPEEFSRILAVAEDGAAPERARRWARQVTARSHDTGRAVVRRTELAARWAHLFTDVDAVLLPVTPTTAPVHDPAPMDDRRLTVNGTPTGYGDQFAWMQTVGALHLPVVTAPVGPALDGLPVGVQVVGPHLEDRTAIDVARRMADVVGGYVPPPMAVT